MGVKSAKQNNQGYRIKGLIFPNVVDFYMLRAIGNNFYNIVEKEGSDYFDNFPKVKVIEVYSWCS